MSAISTILTRLRAAIWAIDVRDDIANAIEQCYSDVSNPTLRTEALEAALQTKIDEGEMAALTIGDHTITAAKLAQGVIDNTLATSGAAADAKKTGDELTAIKADLDALIPGVSEDARDAILSCFEHVVWDGDDWENHYNALKNALFPYGFDWNVAESHELPTGMTADSFSYRSDLNALLIFNPKMQFGNLGDMEVEIECRAYVWDTAQRYGNSPQIVISTGNDKGIKLVAEYGNENTNPSHCYALVADGTTTLLDGIRCNEFHKIIMTAKGGNYSLNIDGQDITVMHSGISQYFTYSGIVSASFQDDRTARILLRSLKYRKL